MADFVLVAQVGPTSAEQEDEFNRWYDEVHIPQVLERIDGVVTARRFRMLDVASGIPADPPVHRYLSVYELDTEDLDGFSARLFGAMQDGTLDMSPALDLTAKTPVVRFYEPIP